MYTKSTIKRHQCILVKLDKVNLTKLQKQGSKKNSFTVDDVTSLPTEATENSNG